MTVQQLTGLQQFAGVIHFIGIGGVGMSGIAEVLANLGCRIQGSDIADNATVRHLREIGCEVFVGHRSENVAAADVVVVSSAVDDDNPEVQTAKANRIPVLKRAEMLAELMRFRYGIAIAGTHGKTTTTSLVATVMSAAELDPTYVIGGKVEGFDSTAGLGASQYLVVEADESDASFLHLTPVIVALTNIDKDHMSTYENDFDKLTRGFSEFIANIPFYGLVVACGDDPMLWKLRQELPRRFLTYGFSEHCDIRITGFDCHETYSILKAALPWCDDEVEMRLNMPGRHNALNAMAAVGVAHELGIDDAVIRDALEHFAGIRRRFQSYGEIHSRNGRILLIDDYAHHPTEIGAAYDACCAAMPERRKILVFQPHRYTRLHDLFDEFSEVLARPDLLLLLDVYAAGEKPIPGADSMALSDAVRARGGSAEYVSEMDRVTKVLESVLCEGDVVMTMGAGSIAALPRKLATELECHHAA